MSTPFVRYALRVTDARIARSERWVARARRITLVVGWLIFLGVAGFLLVLLWKAWQSGSWGDFWAYARDIWPAAGATYLAGRLDVLAERNTIARAVRRVVTADGDQQVALADDQPMPLEDDMLTAAPVRITRLPRPLADSVLGLWIIATMCFLIGGMSLLFAFSFSRELAPLRIAGASLLALTVLLIVAAELRRHDGLIIADDQGLRWRPWGWPFHQIAVRWHAIRQFYVLRSRRSTDGAAESTYVLESDRIHLTWRVHSGMKPTRRAASELLPRLIASNAGLPLRDVTAALRPLDDPGAPQFKRREAAERVLETDPAHGEAANRADDHEVMWFLARLLAPLALIALLYGGGWAAQTYQARAYEGLLVAAHGRAPVFSDALASDDGHWPISTPSALDGHSLSFHDGAYWLAVGNSAHTLYAWAPGHSYSRAAVEVTVRDVSEFGLSGAGIILGDVSGTKSLAFVITPSGSWWLYRFTAGDDDVGDWRIVDIERSDAIVKGPIQPNRLSVVLDGGQCIFYINGHFAAAYRDAVLRSARVGLYVDPTARSAAFSSFAVYPL